MQQSNDERNLAEIFSRAARIPRRKVDDATETNTILEVIQNHFLIKDATPSERRRMEDLAAFQTLYESTSKLAKNSYQISSAEHAYDYLAPDMEGLSYERTDMLVLNTRHRVVKRETIATGGLSSAGISPQKIIRTAVLYNASGIILAHNHPSGEPKPSPDDISTTRHLVKALDLVGIDLVDHLVIGKNDYISMKTAGLMEEKMEYQTSPYQFKEEGLLTIKEAQRNLYKEMIVIREWRPNLGGRVIYDNGRVVELDAIPETIDWKKIPLPDLPEKPGEIRDLDITVGYFRATDDVNKTEPLTKFQVWDKALLKEAVKEKLERLGDLLYVQNPNGEVVWPIEALNAFNEKELRICKKILFPETQPQQTEIKGGKGR